MAIVQNSARAFIASVIVIAAFHVIMTSIGLGTFIASNSTPPSPDRALQLLALRVTTDAALLFTGHWLLRSFGLASRLAYGLMGAAVMATGYAFALTNGLMIMPPLEGARLTAALLPMLVGMIAAVMYAQLAGREFCETPADAGNQQSLPHAAAAAPAAFDGPVQVRTSLLAISASALVPAGIVAFIAVPFASAMFGQWDLQSMRRLEWTTQIQQMALPAFLFMMSLLVTAVPATVAVGITHAIARASRRSRGLDYSDSVFLVSLQERLRLHIHSVFSGN